MRVLGEIETKEVKTKNYRKIVAMKCDMCGCELTKYYASVETHHDRWGNDSCESYKFYDLCFECAKKEFNNYLEKPKHTDSFNYEVCLVSKGDIEVNEKGHILDCDYKYEYKEEEK